MLNRAPAPDAALSRRLAAERLSRPGVRLHLTLAALLCMTFCACGLYLVENLFAIVPWVSLARSHPVWYTVAEWLYRITDIAFVGFVQLPLVFGTARIFLAAADGTLVPLGTMFSCFERGRYLRSIAVMATLLLPRLALFALMRYSYDWLSLVPAPWGVLLWGCLSLCLVVGTSFLLGWDDALLPLALRREHSSILSLWQATRRLTRGRLTAIWRFKWSFFGWGLASVATLGIVFFVHALPYYCLTHTALTDPLYDSASDGHFNE